MTSTRDLAALLDAELRAGDFDDYAPNGLQVECSDQLETVVFGVSANAALIDAAVELDADALVVHHGFFWRGEDRTITGLRARRIAPLFAHGISLLGYHLPLDAHAELGNAAGVLAEAGVTAPSEPFANAGRTGLYAAPEPVGAVVDRLAASCGAPRAAFLYGPERIRRVTVVTGGGPGYFEAAVAAGADLFVTGEASEQSQGLARELGANFVAFGHHATERFGPRSLADFVADATGLRCLFVDVDNPV